MATIPTDQDLLNAARQALNDILHGRVSEFQEGTEHFKMLSVGELRAAINELQSRVNRSSKGIFRPIRTGRCI